MTTDTATTPARSAPAEQGRFDRLRAATAGLEPPFGVIDLDAFDANAVDLERRAGGKPIRLASKSLRSRALIRRALARPGFQGILGFTLPEALWLAEEFEDVVVGYPTTDATALRRLAADEQLASRITLMVDSVEHLDLVDAATGPRQTRVRVCLELDAALRLAGGRLHLGPRRSPVHTPREAAAFAREVAARPGFELAGIMGYEGQVAGLGDNQPGSLLKRAVVRAMQRSSVEELRHRREAAVAAVRALTPLRFVNGGGTGSLETTTREDAVTELAAGSGLYGPGLFDFYRSFRPVPAAYFVLPVVRRPSPKIATLLGGGWIASGPPGKDRLPTLAWPPACASPPPKRRARCRPRCSASPRRSCASETGCGCGTPRPVNCASGSANSTWSAAARWSTPYRRTGARAGTSCDGPSSGQGDTMTRITDRTVLVVGASSGIGAEVARRLAHHGNRLVITARRAPELASVAEEIRAAGSACLDIAADALDPGAASAVVAACVAEYGSVDIALLNAGQGPDMSMDQVTVADIARITALNYDVVVHYLVPLIAQMKTQREGGLIAHTNSLAGLMGIPRQGPYSAAKAAARTLIDTARVELAPHGIRFTSVHPGFVATDRVGADGLPKPFQVSQNRAARHVVRALEREPAQAYFPWTTTTLVRTLRTLPTPLSALILRKLASR